MPEDAQEAALHYRACRPTQLACLLEKDVGFMMMNVLLIRQRDKDICIEE
jgi:hypothetical protein